MYSVVSISCWDIVTVLGRIFFILFVKSSLQFHFLFFKTLWTKESGALIRKSKTMGRIQRKTVSFILQLQTGPSVFVFRSWKFATSLLLRLGSNYIVHSFLCNYCLYVCECWYYFKILVDFIVSLYFCYICLSNSNGCNDWLMSVKKIGLNEDFFFAEQCFTFCLRASVCLCILYNLLYFSM